MCQFPGAVLSQLPMHAAALFSRLAQVHVQLMNVQVAGQVPLSICDIAACKILVA